MWVAKCVGTVHDNYTIPFKCSVYLDVYLQVSLTVRETGSSSDKLILVCKPVRVYCSCTLAAESLTSAASDMCLCRLHIPHLIILCLYGYQNMYRINQSSGFDFLRCVDILFCKPLLQVTFMAQR